ncbi:MAG: helix-turn-helix transcriptional regulator [Pseudomonadales bacterium]
MARTTLKSFKKKALEKPRVKAAYDELDPAYQLRKKLIEIRQRAGLTQEEIASLLNTNKSNISRLESVDSSISPKLSTISEYARAAGYRIKIDFVREKGTT